MAEHAALVIKSFLSCFGGWVLHIWIVFNSYFSITLKKKDWSFYLYFFGECPWSKNSTKSVKHISNNFIQDFCLSKAAIMDMERKLSNSTFDWYRFHHGWTSLRPTLHVWKLLTASSVCSLCASLTECSAYEYQDWGEFSVFSKRNKHNNTVRKTRHEAFLNSNFYWGWIKNTQEIHQRKLLKLDQRNAAESTLDYLQNTNRNLQGRPPLQATSS